MLKAAEYLQRSVEAEMAAAMMESPRIKDHLNSMARAWRTLAVRALRPNAYVTNHRVAA
jgi:hypothetical protein